MHKPTFTITVRTLVEYLLQSGDLYFDYFGSASAIEGIRAHQKIQRQRPDHYQSEVSVHFTAEFETFFIKVTGRIDGVMSDGTKTVVEEIKSTRTDLDQLEQTPNSVHWGQAQCYAYMWAIREKIASVVVCLTYVNLDSGRIRSLEKVLDIESLTVFFDDLLGRYAAWMSKLARWITVRDQTISSMVFPFEHYRSGQRAMAVAVFRAIRDGDHLLVQAATGIGKTIATLFPAIKCLGEGQVDKVIFLTARTTGQQSAEAALAMMRMQGLRIKSVTLTAKDKICFFPDSACTPEACECARGYFDRIHGAVTQALNSDSWTRSHIENIAGQHRICPFEFSLELVDWADCVIGDYNYVFAPGVMLQRLFEEGRGKSALLVDEAHNLVDRAREMFSAQLLKQVVLALRRQLKIELSGVYKSLGRINAWMAVQRRKCDAAGHFLVEQQLPDALLDHLRGFLHKAEKWLTLNIPSTFRDMLLDFFFEVLRFVRVAENFDSSYQVTYETTGKALRIKLFCIDPSNQLRQAWQRSQSAILFSATLTPGGYFRSVLGCRENAAMLNLPSPFPPERLAVLVADKISTYYTDRQDTCPMVTDAIIRIVNQHTGHYMVYFPSYAYLEMVYKHFSKTCEKIEIVLQTPEMDEKTREQFLSKFNSEIRHSLVGFAVMGGIFGEGIDLTGDRLTGAIIVGVGLPGISLERDLIKEYFDRNNGCGFEYAYQYPGINRVLQAAGRVIRSESDQGIVFLIDKRYSQYRYKAMLPRTWRLDTLNSDTPLEDCLHSFWRRYATVRCLKPL